MNSPGMHTLWQLAISVMLLNIPFGFWRGGAKRFTLPWFLAVHIPVPFVVGLRLLSKLGWGFATFPVLIGSYLLGQFLGGRLRKLWKRRTNALAAKHKDTLPDSSGQSKP